MSTLDEMKREARREFDKKFQAENGYPRDAMTVFDVLGFIDGLADQLVTVIEKEVVPEEHKPGEDDGSVTFVMKRSHNNCRSQVLARFRAFGGIKEKI